MRILITYACFTIRSRNGEIPSSYDVHSNQEIYISQCSINYGKARKSHTVLQVDVDKVNIGYACPVGCLGFNFVHRR